MGPAVVKYLFPAPVTDIVVENGVAAFKFDPTITYSVQAVKFTLKALRIEV